MNDTAKNSIFIEKPYHLLTDEYEPLNARITSINWNIFLRSIVFFIDIPDSEAENSPHRCGAILFHEVCHFNWPLQEMESIFGLFFDFIHVKMNDNKYHPLTVTTFVRNCVFNKPFMRVDMTVQCEQFRYFLSEKSLVPIDKIWLSPEELVQLGSINELLQAVVL